MMKKISILLMLLAYTAVQAYSQQAEGSRTQGVRVYSIGVSESMDSYEINEKLMQYQDEMASTDRGIVSDIFLAYRSSTAKKAGSIIDILVEAGIDELAELVKDHRKDWQKAIQQECSFSKGFKMGDEISDFYQSSSRSGALDLQDIAFNGFSCRQYIHRKNAEPLEVFYAEFSLDTTETGLRRMVHHSKFEVVLDSLMFNPFICEIPNDSTSSPDLRIGFDFERRKDLKVSLKTIIRSSWVCENMAIVSGQPLGEFLMEVSIDPKYLVDNCFTYSRMNPDDEYKNNLIRCSGESFMVPRSYIGMIDNTAYWGTGQYSLDMTLKESCRINEAYYKKTGSDGKVKWDRKKWKEEWKIIRKRKKYHQAHLNTAFQKITSSWKNGQWITEFISPSTTVLVSNGKQFINSGLVSAPATSETPSATEAGMPSKSNPK